MTQKIFPRLTRHFASIAEFVVEVGGVPSSARGTTAPAPPDGTLRFNVALEPNNDWSLPAFAAVGVVVTTQYKTTAEPAPFIA